MSEPTPADSSTPGGGRRANPMMLVFNTAVLVFLVVAGISVLRHKGKAPEETPLAVAPSAAPHEEGVLSVTLFFASADAQRLVPERREIAAGSDAIEATVRSVIGELAAGPTGDGAPVLPPGAIVERVFLDDEGTLTLDFDPSLRDSHWGGTAAERLTLEALRQTIAVNFSSVRSIQILVAGEPVETIGGHLDAMRALPAGGR